MSNKCLDLYQILLLHWTQTHLFLFVYTAFSILFQHIYIQNFSLVFLSKTKTPFTSVLNLLIGSLNLSGYSKNTKVLGRCLPRKCLAEKKASLLITPALNMYSCKELIFLFVSPPLVNSSSSAPCPCKCCHVSHTTRSGCLTNRSVVGGGPQPRRNVKWGQYIRLRCHEPRQESTHRLERLL